MVKGDKAKRRRKATAGHERGGVQSVRVATRIMQALAKGGGALPLKDIAKATALARAKVHRYLTSLQIAEFVAQDPSSGHYQIGPAAIGIGLAGLRRISTVSEICNALPALRDAIDQTITVAVWGDSGPVIVAMEESRAVITMNVRIGSTLPVLTTAIGRMFLAHLPQAITRPLVAAERQRAREKQLAVPSAEEIAGLLDEIRSRRLSRAPSALLPGVDAIAAPVFDYREGLVAVMCVVARSEHKITGWNGTAVRALTLAAHQLSGKLGSSTEAPVPNEQTLRSQLVRGRNSVARKTWAGS